MANLSQIKREQMIGFLEKLKEQHSDDESLIAINQIERELTSKKYGLVWEEHEEEVDVKMQTHIPVFTEVREREIVGDSDSEEYNFLLEGDNLHSLKLLEKTHRGKIDVIYIDPPYNTGGTDFRYEDSFVGKEDGFRHSKWISFMNNRLFIAKKLLSARGVMFISIDDNEQAALKLLCDEILGLECFVADISWQRTYSMRNDTKGIPAEIEHILVYSKQTEWIPKRLPRTKEMDSKYKNPDGDINGDWQNTSAFAPGALSHQGMVYAIQHPFTGELLYPTISACWRYSQDSMLEYMNGWANYKLEDLHDDEERARICGIDAYSVRKGVKGIVLQDSLEDAKKHAQEIYERGNWPRFYFTNKGQGGIRRKTYKNNLPGKTVTNFWPFTETGHTDEAKKELISIFSGKAPFDTPKPTRLIERLLMIASDANSLVLDFFAGSGTTGQAVLELNKKDGGNRHFILCTNNENNICEEVTYQRLKTVITGKRADGSEYSEGLPANLKYYKTGFVAKDSEEIYDNLLEHIEEMIQLQYGIKIDNKKYVIIMDDEEMDDFEKSFADYKDLQVVFINQYVLLSTSQENMLQNINTYIIPDCYFDSELREAGELW